MVIVKSSSYVGLSISISVICVVSTFKKEGYQDLTTIPLYALKVPIAPSSTTFHLLNPNSQQDPLRCKARWQGESIHTKK